MTHENSRYVKLGNVETYTPADVWAGRKALEAEYGWSLSDDAAWTFLRAVVRSVRLRESEACEMDGYCVLPAGHDGQHAKERVHPTDSGEAS
jgi:hypothetical protein